MIEKQTRKKIKRLRTNNDMEFCSGEFNKFSKDEGIVRHCIVRHKSKKNDMVECMTMTIHERAHCKLSNAKMENEFWNEIVFTTCYLVSKSLSTVIECKTLEEV